jgi:ABC-type sugar transport system permease subunit/ABC-type glycerol-3-phosphate transport system substrate-binding protein
VSPLLRAIAVLAVVMSMALPLAARETILFATNSTQYREGYEQLAREYMELHPDVEVKIAFITLNYETWVRTQFAGGERLAPDIYHGNVTNNYGHLGRWVPLDDHLNRVSPYTGETWIESLDKHLLDKGKEAGRYYHVPLDFIEIGVFYNKSVFDREGYEIPETWDEMMELCARIEADGITPFAVPAALREVWETQVGWVARMLGDTYYRPLVPLVMAREGDWDFDPERGGTFEQDFTNHFDDMLVDINRERLHRAILEGEIDFRDERSRRIYQRIKDWSRYWQPGFLGANGETAHRLFLSQKALMELHHSGNVTWMLKEIEDLPADQRFEWSVFGVPPILDDDLAVPQMRGMGGLGTLLTITRKSDPRHEAKVIDFAMFMTTPRAMQTIVDLAIKNRRAITGPPAIKGVELDPIIAERFEPFYGRGYERVNFRGLDDEQESVYEWSVLLQDYLGDRITLDEFLEEYQQTMLRAHERIRERFQLDMDPATNDQLRVEEARALRESRPPSNMLSTSVLAMSLLAVMAGLLSVFYVANPAGLARREALAAYVLIGPTVVLAVLFLYYPAILGLLGAFTEWEEGGSPRFVGLHNFAMLAQDRFFLTSIWNQALLLAAGILKATLVPFIVAELVFAVANTRMQYWIRTAFLVPLVVPGMVTLLIWRFVYDPQIGVLNNILSSVGLDFLTRAWLGDPGSALPSIIFLGFPWIGAFGFLIYLAALYNLSSSLIDASRMECRSIFQRILYVDAPLLKAQTGLLVVLTMIGTLQEFQSILILTEGGPGTSTIVPALRMFHSAFRFNHFGYGASIGFVLFMAIVLLTLLSRRAFRREVS